MIDQNKAEFDDFASDYVELIEGQKSFFAKNRSYFAFHKSLILQRICARNNFFPRRILEFGCGVGLNIPHIQHAFPKSDIFASDISAASLAHVRNNLKQVSCINDDELDKNVFDLILVSCVLHHILPIDRQRVLKRLQTLLSVDGIICFVEHNPFNPVTRRMVSTCPFDRDAVLLSMSDLKRDILDFTELKIYKSAYCLFFPEWLRFFNRFEFLFGKIPVGGQYYVAVSTD